ncbi:MAG: hypothetical protein V3U88_09190 [Methylococcales bacterium]
MNNRYKQLPLLLILAFMFLGNGLFSPVKAAIIDIRISASSDDAEENTATGKVNRGSSDLELVDQGSLFQLVGMRFNSLDIPQGATITNAYIQFQADETHSGTTTLVIEGQATDDASTFTNANTNISSRPLTGATVNWDPAPWTTVGEAGSDQQTPDITSVIQEIVDRSGWSTGNSLAIIIRGSGRRAAESFNGDATGAALLHVEYSSGTGINQAPTVDAGSDQTINLPTSASDVNVTLNGSVSDDGLPTPPELLTTWSQESGPGIVIFGNANAVDTTATFDLAGTYVLRLTGDDSDLSTIDELTVTVNAAGIAMNLAVRVSASSDDAEENTATGKVNRGSSDLELVDQGSLFQLVGMRFNGLNIPQGATITSAFIQFQADETHSGTTSLTIEGQATDDAQTYTNVNANISSRDRTNATVNWDPAPWTTVGEAGFDQQTPDITSVIQEIVDRSGWSTGNSLAIIISGSGRRTAESFNGDPIGAPLLRVTFETEVTVYEIGDNGPAGGIVFYVTDGGLNGLEAAPVDQSTFREWGCKEILIMGADGTAIGTGAQNTLDIVAGCNEGPAAKVAADYTSPSGFNDWFLPSRDELNLMYMNLHLNGLGDFTNDCNRDRCIYWSSSEIATNEVWAQQFSPEGDFQFGNDKEDSNYKVRAIRAFSSTDQPTTDMAPIATNVTIIDNNGGMLEVGDSLTGNYTYSDAENDLEGTTTFRWFRDGVWIRNALSSTYTAVRADAGTTLTLEVTPVAVTGNSPGISVISPVGLTVEPTFVLARAYINRDRIDGFDPFEDLVIAELLDTDPASDAVASVGDTVILNQYPTSFDPCPIINNTLADCTDIGTFSEKEFPIVNITTFSNTNTAFSTVFQEDAHITWNISNGSERLEGISILDEQIGPFDGFIADFLVTEMPENPDVILLKENTTGNPQPPIERKEMVSQQDDYFINVEFFFTP